MVGDTEKTTSFGTGIQDQTQGFITFTAEDEMTPWEETINRDLFTEAEDDYYAHFTELRWCAATSRPARNTTSRPCSGAG